MRKQAVIFDLDGTLLNTLADLAESVNRILIEEGREPHDGEAYRYFVGNGAVKMIERAFAPAEVDGRDYLPAFNRHYDELWDATTAPYEGVADLLQQLQDRGIAVAVLSNKPHKETGKCAGRFFPSAPFKAVLGQREGIPKKPDPAPLLALLDEQGWRNEECLFVGDSSVDMDTAVNSGVKGIGVSWGFRSSVELFEHGAAAVIDHPSELLSFLD